jgi:dTDP-4-dehydrorhamnose reductase
MRILVIGRSSQVGGALIKELRDHEIIAADRHLIDFSRPQRIPYILEELKPEFIINAAAFTAVDEAESQQNLAYAVNAAAPAAIAQWASPRGIPLVHFSTDYVFNGRGDQPWREKDAPDPLSAYGQTKFDGERAVRAAGGTSLIVRTSWVYAAVGKNFLRTIARLARERARLRIVADQIGAPTSAAQIASSLSRMCAGALDSFHSRCQQCDGVVHFTASGETSWYGFAQAIVEGLKVRHVPLVVEEIIPITTDDYPTPARRPHNSRLDLGTLRRIFEITPTHWLEALALELDVLAAESR